MSQIVNTGEQYRLLIDGDLLKLMRQALELEKQYSLYQEREEVDEAWAVLHDKLYELYQEIGWSVMYEMRQLPF